MLRIVLYRPNFYVSLCNTVQISLIMMMLFWRFVWFHWPTQILISSFRLLLYWAHKRFEPTGIFTCSIRILLFCRSASFSDGWDQWRIFVNLVKSCCNVNYIISLSFIKVIFHWAIFVAALITGFRWRNQRLGLFFKNWSLGFQSMIRVGSQQIFWPSLNCVVLRICFRSISLQHSFDVAWKSGEWFFNNHRIDICLQVLSLILCILALFNSVNWIRDRN